MNIMRKLLVGRPACGAPEEAGQSSQHTALGLMHLHKLFAELIHSQEPLSQQEQEHRLYNMLPLFCKVFGNSPASDLMDKFSDILTFCQLVSRLMVSEIRRRASNQSTEAASCAIAKFLEIESTEEQSNGWMLLTTVNLLSAGGTPLIEVMTSSSLPSTLVKCLYLFFDLSEQENPDELGSDCEFTPKERRILLQKVFVQVLVRLCSNVAPAEELARKDDLTLLFSAITSWCPPHNTVWRKSAAEVLMTLSRHGLTNPVVTYIHTKGCVGLCIENMQRVQELSPLEIVDMFVTVFCFLKDSSEVSQILLDDFRSCQGYIFLSDFLLRLEQNTSSEACEALRNIILLIASLTNCGYFELKPSHASTGVLFQIPGFQMPMPSGRGVSVRNIQAFQVLQSVFLKAQTTYLCNVVLDAISTVYHSDKANYFILEAQHTLSQLVEKIYLKPHETQEKFFKLFEFIIFEINYVPCKELISLSILLKTQSSMSCSITCLRTLISVLQYQGVFKDVFREVGLLEVLVTCLHRYASQLKEVYPEGAGKGKVLNVPEDQQTLGELTMEALTVLLNSNSNNAAVFRESGGARCAHNLVPYSVCRLAALGIVQQLVLNNGGDDDMGTLLGLMHTAPVTALDLKSHILKSLLFVLRESHRTRTVFRKVGGFVYVMSVLVSMEGCLASPPRLPWDAVEKKEIMSLLRTVFSTLAMAMRYEPANARFFASEICHTSLTDTIRLLGCFTDHTELKSIEAFTPTEELTFHAIFTNGKDTRNEETTVPDVLVSVCLVIRLLYDMALDAFDRPSQVLNWIVQPPTLKRWHSESSSVNEGTLSPTQKRSTIVPLSLTPPAPEPVIVHPGVVMTVLHLLPSVMSLEHPKAGLTLQVYLAEVLRSLVRSERNQQVMCEAGLPGELLSHCTMALEGEVHPLHPSLQYILERLSAQALEPKDLRAFLRLGSPLCCTPFDAPVQEMSGLRPANQRDGGPVPLTRVKTLVSMTTPRDCRLHGTAITPPFVEFDMSSEGFSCLFVPSIAPQSAAGPAVVGVGMVGIGPDSSVIGGIGTGDRVFPPQPGLSFSTWFCVDKFSDNHADPHPVRLLTLVRQVPGREDHLICFNLQLSPRDKSILITTQETAFNQSAFDWEPEAKDEVCSRIWTPELLQESQWHHLVVVLNRAVLKNSSLSVYVDGQILKSQKMHYISQNPGGGAANLTVASSVHGFIGTPPQFRRTSRLVWKQGPCHLLEDVLSPNAALLLYNLGPSYVGSLQAPFIKSQELQSSVVPEERVILGLNSSAVSVMTLARIRRVYTKTDCKSIAKMLGLSSHENATPIHILHNSAGHLGGPARSLGGVLIGYLGARVFVPRPVALTLQTVGGTGALLGLVAMAKDVEGLYAAVKALVCVARSNTEAQQEMDYMRRYQTLAMLLRKKQDLLNSHILHLTFSLVGTVDSGRETTVIPNRAAFQDLLCNLEVWQDAPGDLHKSLYEHFYELVTESCEQKTNLQILRNVDMVSRLLQVLSNPRLSPATVRILCNLLSALLQNTNRPSDILCFGQFCAATLPSSVLSEKDIPLVNLQASGFDLPKNSELCDDISPHAIQLRNKCLLLLHSLMFSINGNVNLPFCEEVIRVLGMDWVLLFVQSHLHSSTVLLGLQLLTVLLSSPGLLQRFKDASQNGGWLKETEAVLRNRIGVLLGFNVGASNNKSSHTREIKAEAYQISGFQQLQWTLGYHTHITEAYFLLFAILLGQPAHRIPTSNKVLALNTTAGTMWKQVFPNQNNPSSQLSLDSLWSYLTGAAPVSACRGELCPEIAVVLLAMVRAMLNPTLGKGSLPAESPDCPVILIQFLMFLYHNRPNFMLLCMTSEVLSALASTLFPLMEDSASERNSTGSSPTEDFHSFSSFEDTVIIPHVESGGTLTSHPAHKIITDFTRVIIIDSLSLPPGNKQMPVIDMLLEGFPVQSSHSQQCEFMTEVLFSLMEHLMAAQVLIGEQGGLPIATGGSYSNVAPNVFYLTATLVDRLWQGYYTRNSHEVLDFLLKLMNQIKKKYSNSGLDTLFHSLNRTILYQLSRPMDDVVVMTSVLLCLQKVLTFKETIFGSSNNETEFVGCLCYCLFQLTEEAHISMETSRHSTWHVNIPDKNKVIAIHDKAALVKDTACQVWEELFSSKRQVIEELYKISATGMGSAVSKSQMANIHMARMLFHESSCKVWTTFLESEKRSSYSKETWQLHTQLQTKLQKVTGGLTRLATRKIKKEPTLKSAVSNMSYNEVEMWTLIHISVVRDVVELRAKHYQQTQQHLFKYLFEEWLQTETELTRERGLWGPPVASCLDKWMLDMTEGPFRMRKKMVKNELFYIHYPYRPEVEGGENRALKYKVATSLDSKEYYKRWRPETMVEQDAVSPESTGIVTEELAQDVECSEEREIGFQGLRTASLLPRPPVNRGSSEWDEEQESFDQGPEATCGDQDCRQQEDNPDSQSVLRLLEEGEKISHMFRIARIQGLDTCEGLLLFGKEHFYVVDGFTLLKTREIRDIDSLPANMHDPIIPSSTPRNKHQKRTCSKFAYEDIREVHKRRYLLQPIALEVFSADGRNYLLAFPRKIRNKVYARFLNVATAITDNAQESLSGQKRGANVESSANLLSSLIGETSVTQRWVRGEISNFQYLMHLNTLAGRSYNDLMQYPVFPWVLADYESEELDFNKARTFRDLSRPMGAQTPDRLMQFKKRFREWDDPHGETPPYHFGTFYSSAMIVASYLVRMEPFTQHFLRLQGGHFDLADRMFHSIRDAWLSASKHNMADVKELIPEFFYLPEFLVNSNRFDLGHKQCGIQLDDVILPAWAKNDPREFIRVHRQALECDFVSSHLHEWIDLIFGCKQQGQPAIEAVNVFHHLFYEGNVDIYSIDDPLKKNATIGFINNFGQIPKQLFKKPHPVKKLTNRSSVVDPGPIMPGLSCSPDKLFFHNLDNLKPSLHPVKEVKGPVGQIIQVEKSLLAVEQNKILVPSQFTRYIAWGFADHSIRIGLYENERAQFVCEDTPAGEILCCACPNEKTIVTAGTNTMVTVWQWDKKRLHIKRNLYGHTEPVTCLTASRAYNLVVSGSRDHTCILWDLSRLTLVRQLHGHPAPVAAVAINELTGDIASCAGTFLYVWSINGQSIASMNTAMGRSDRTQQILCVSFSTLNEWDNQNVIMTGATDGVVRMWSTDYVQVPIEEPNRESPEENHSSPEDLTKLKNTKSKSQEESTDAKANKGEEIVRRMSLADTENRKELFEGTLLPGVCHKVGSESSLSEEDESFTILEVPQEGALSPSSSQQLKACMGNGSNTTTNNNNNISNNGSNSLGVKGSSLQHSKSIGGIVGRGEIRHTTSSGHPPVLRSITVATTKPISIASGEVEQGEDPTKGLRVSKSDTSLADNNPPLPEEVGEGNFFRKQKKKHRILREGFKWQCQLVFRSKLTMHTAFDRKDNTDPAAVTSLAVSKDHKTVYVGDSKGRVFSWSVTDHPGRADHWVRDEGGDVCLSCGVRFSFAERRHHCRNCGQLFCSKCSRFESEITRLRILKPVRVCQSCYQNLRTDTWSSI